mgnify:CR=1 FL=1
MRNFIFRVLNSSLLEYLLLGISMYPLISYGLVIFLIYYFLIWLFFVTEMRYFLFVNSSIFKNKLLHFIVSFILILQFLIFMSAYFLIFKQNFIFGILFGYLAIVDLLDDIVISLNKIPLIKKFDADSVSLIIFSILNLIIFVIFRVW